MRLPECRSCGRRDVDSHTTNIISVCAGVGMFDIAAHAAFEFLGLKPRTVCYVEREAFAASQLVARMESESLDEAPIWSDLVTFDGKPWRGIVDCIIGGLPCQPYSVAGVRRGLDDYRSYGDGNGPIPHALRIVEECRPSLVIFENVPAWVRGGFFEPVGTELSRMGYTVFDPIFIAAEDVGAAHKRERVFVMAYARLQHINLFKRQIWEKLARDDEELVYTDYAARSRFKVGGESKIPRHCVPSKKLDSTRGDIFSPGPSDERWSGIINQYAFFAPAVEPGFRVLVDGSPISLDESHSHQCRAIGNGCVPLQAAVAIVELLRAIEVA